MSIWNLNNIEYFLISTNAEYGEINDWKIVITDLSSGNSIDETNKCTIVKLNKPNSVNIEYSVKINTSTTITKFNKNTKYQVSAYSDSSELECNSDFITINDTKNNWVMRTVS